MEIYIQCLECRSRRSVVMIVTGFRTISLVVQRRVADGAEAHIVGRTKSIWAHVNYSGMQLEPR